MEIGKVVYEYNGKENHEELGLNWLSFKFRWYDPAIGRFPSVDPIADEFADLSGFNYANNDPIGKIDLWGLQGEDFNRVYSEGMLEESHFVPADQRPKTYEGGYEEWAADNPNAEITYTLNERLHKAGMMLGWASPSAKVVRAGSTADDIIKTGDDVVDDVVKVGDDIIKTGDDVVDDFLTISPDDVVTGEGVSLESVADLVTKMRAKGFDKSQPIEVIELYKKKYLLNGHHRVAAAKELGIDVTYKSLTAKEAIAKYKFRDVQEIIWRAIEFQNRGKN